MNLDELVLKSLNKRPLLRENQRGKKIKFIPLLKILKI